jgi:hypothetical protein
MNPSMFDFRRSAILHSAVFYWGLGAPLEVLVFERDVIQETKTEEG